MAYHLYPQLIPQFCLTGGFGPPVAVRRPSPWPWLAHPASGLIHATFRRSGIALFGLAFATAPSCKRLNLATQINSSAHSSIGTPSPFRRKALTACRHTVSGLFHSPPGVLFTFPSRYSFTIGRQEYLALECGHPSFPQDFTCPVVLKIMTRSLPLSPTGLSPSAAAHSRDLQLGLWFVTPGKVSSPFPVMSYNPPMT